MKLVLFSLVVVGIALLAYHMHENTKTFGLIAQKFLAQDSKSQMKHTQQYTLKQSCSNSDTADAGNSPCARLAKSLTFETLYATANASAFEAFRQYLEVAFPLVHSKLEREVRAPCQ